MARKNQMRAFTQNAFLLFALICCRAGAWAEPDLGRVRVAGPLPVVYADARDPRLFYYPPGKLLVADDTSGDGSPDLRFLQMIYTGTQATSDPGQFIARSVLSFRVVRKPLPPESLRAALAALPPNSQLRPLPIVKAEDHLIWAPIQESGDTASVAPAPSHSDNALSGGGFEESGSGSLSTPTGHWSERIYSLHPDPLSSQALWDAFHHGRVLISLAYVLYTHGRDDGLTLSTGTRDAVRAADAATIAATSDDKNAESKDLLVFSDTIPITVDASRYPDHFRRIDINESVPPGYAALDFRCYDFGNALRPDLALKIVDVRAKGVDGATVTRAVTFRASSPDLTSASLQFPFAVRLDQPFSYRVTEVLKDGTLNRGVWIEEKDWSHVVDITTRPAQPLAGTPGV
jgi:hypothetical protein